MALLLIAALLGGFAIFGVLLPHGALTALVATPFGGSFLCLMAGLLLALLRTRAERSVEATSDVPTASHITR
jgi:hypothetical protein